MFVFQKCLQPILPTLVDHGLVMLGEPNQGKTPRAGMLALMFSRHYISKFGYQEEPQFRAAPDFDFPWRPR